jgi:hypothetical protein
MGTIEVTGDDVDLAIRRRAMMRGVPVGVVAPPNVAGDPDFVRTLAVEILQNRELLVTGERLELMPSLDEILSAWQEHPQLRELYLPDLDEVDARLAQWEGLSTPDIYYLLRLELVMERWLQQVIERVTEGQLQEAYRWRNDTLELRVVEVPNLPSVETIDAFIEAPPEPDYIESFYRSHPGRFAQPAAADLRIVRVLVAQDADDGEEAAARRRIELLLEEARAGGDLVAMSIDRSDDPAAQSGGLRPRVTRRQLPAALDTPPGELSDVERDRYGLFFFRVEARYPHSRRSLDSSVAREIASRYLSRNVETDEARTIAEAVIVVLRAGNEDELERLRREHHLIDRVIGPIRQEEDGMIPGIGTDPELLGRLFDLTPADPVLSAPELVDGRLIAVRLEERRVPTPDDYDRDSGAFRESYIQRIRGTAWDAFWAERLRESPLTFE